MEVPTVPSREFFCPGGREVDFDHGCPADPEGLATETARRRAGGAR